MNRNLAQHPRSVRTATLEIHVSSDGVIRAKIAFCWRKPVFVDAERLSTFYGDCTHNVCLWKRDVRVSFIKMQNEITGWKIQ